MGEGGLSDDTGSILTHPGDGVPGKRWHGCGCKAHGTPGRIPATFPGIQHDSKTKCFLHPLRPPEKGCSWEDCREQPQGRWEDGMDRQEATPTAPQPPRPCTCHCPPGSGCGQHEALG